MRFLHDIGEVLCLIALLAAVYVFVLALGAVMVK